MKQPWVILIKGSLEPVESWVSSVQPESILICRHENGTVYFVDPSLQEPVVLEADVPEALDLPGMFDFLSFMVMKTKPEDRKEALLILLQNVDRIPYNIGRETTKRINGGRNRVKVAVEPGVYADDIQKWLRGGVQPEIYLAKSHFYGHKIIDFQPQLELFCHS